MEEIKQEIKIEDFDLGTLEKILLKTKNDEAINEVVDEIAKIDTMADRLSRHASKLLDIMEEDDVDAKPKRLNSKPTRKPSSVYVSSQIANMISMKTLKLALLKHKNDLGTSSLDRAMKILTSINKDGDSARELPLQQVLALLLSKDVIIPTNAKLLDVIDIDETDIDAELDAIISSSNISLIQTNENESPIQELVAVKLYLDTKEDKIFLLSDNDTIISEVEEDLLDVTELEDGTFYCDFHQLPIESDD